MSENVDLERFERCIVHYCAPTLAGFKPGNLFNFSCRFGESETAHKEHLASNRRRLVHAVKNFRARSRPFDLDIAILAFRDAGALIYVYRPLHLRTDFADEAIASFLEALGYPTQRIDTCVQHLRRRIAVTDSRRNLDAHCAFPHEIGFFLGYPFEDVVGFIENEGRDYLYCGCWKVYANERDARDCFCRYKTCTEIYDTLLDRGLSIEDLAKRDDDLHGMPASMAPTR